MCRKSQSGKFMDILKCILWDFDKKSGYFLFFAELLLLCWFLRPFDTFQVISGTVS